MMWKIKAAYQQRLARERGTVRKDHGGKIRVALAYPNTYYVGMSNLGFLLLYRMLNQRQDIVAERVFLPDSEELAFYRNSGDELLSLESQRPVSDFDAIAFSISFENDFSNILTLLDFARIPSPSSERRPSHPLVLAGGVATFLNPEPIAAFIDLFLIGEAEALIEDMVDFLRQWRRTPEKKQETLREYSHRPGFYVPSLYEVIYDERGLIREFQPKPGAPPKVVRARIARLDQELPASSVVTPDTEFGDITLLEIGRACGRGCRFCAAGYIYRPPRPVELSQAKRHVDQLIEQSPRFGLISPGIVDLPYLPDLLEYIKEKGGSASLSSVRADSLGQDLLTRLEEMGQKSLAIAPEAGSERLRTVINKGLTDDDIFNATLRLLNAGVKTIKLYFMVGLPTEEMEDVEAIITLVKKIRHHFLKERQDRSKTISLHASVAPFVPKASTPFQWEPMDTVANLKKKIALLRKGIGALKGARLSHEPPKWAYTQALMARGDRRVAAVLTEYAATGDWRKAFTRTTVNPDFFVHRSRDKDEILPWDFIDHGIRKSFLWSEYERALQGKLSPRCEPGDCRRCGVC